MKGYQPKNSLTSPRFEGIKTFMRLPHIETLDNVDFLIVGLPFDTSCSYRVGARFAPAAIREASVFNKNYNYELDVEIFEHLSGVDYGDIDIVPGYIEKSYEKIEAGLGEIYKKNIVPICLGGDHSVTLPQLRSIKDAFGPVALVQFDSHSDTFDEYCGQKYNHATPFRRAIEEGCMLPENSIQVGLRGAFYSPRELEDIRALGLDFITAHELHQIGIAETVARISKRVNGAPVFVTFDIDFIDPAYAPGTGTPEVGGFTTAQAQELVRGLRGLDFKGFDVVEVLPAYDPGQITSFAAANIAWQFISLMACNAADRKKA
jgi:agmatinase